MRLYITLLCLFAATTTWSQEPIQIKTQDKQTGESLPYVTILKNKKEFAATTDIAGIGKVILTSGNHMLSFLMTGFRRVDTTITVPMKDVLIINMEPESESLEEVTIVSSGRNNERMESSPLKVEVLGAAELSEEAGIKPGNIASILGDVSGVQIQQSSATSGNSNVRIQGLDGRYTQILRDGMPLYDGFSGGFGILTVPPLDLQQIELIKGSASTLYGGGAIGGLVNLISKRPTYEQKAEALINYTTLREYNANAFASKRNDKLGYTLFAGYTGQQAVDVNGDGLSDVPDMGSFLVHPRVYYYPSAKTTLSVGYTGSFDNRKGGDMAVLANNADNVHQYYEENISQRHTAEYFAEHTYDKGAKLWLRGNVSRFEKMQNTNIYAMNGRQTSYYDEVSALIPVKQNKLVAGMNIVGDDYVGSRPDTLRLRTYSNFTAGAFAQYSLHLGEHTTIEAGMRTDHHKTYGFFVLPRLAAYHKLNEHWATRAGFGTGYKVPNPLVQQNIDYNPMYLLPVNSAAQPEKAYGGNAEVNYKKKWDNDVSLFINLAFFLTQVEQPIVFQQAADNTISLSNAASPVVSKGSDTYVKLDVKSWELYLGYTLTDARYTYKTTGNNFAPLTPRQRCAFVLVHEIGDKWRFGLEGSYMGSQYRYDGTATPDYVFLAAMVQRNLGKNVALVLNGENLLDYRMSRIESLYTGSLSNPNFKPLWAPIDGRVLNLSVRWKL